MWLDEASGHTGDFGGGEREGEVAGSGDGLGGGGRGCCGRAWERGVRRGREKEVISVRRLCSWVAETSRLDRRVMVMLARSEGRKKKERRA